jgi:arylformamidase
VIEIPRDVQAIAASHIEATNLDGITRVLFKTRNSAFWNDTQSGFRTDFTYLEPDAALALVERGVRLVGIDYLSVEKFDSKDFQTHITLLERGVVIVEGLDLREVAAGDYELICLPLKLADGTGDGAPARAVLRTLE